MTKLGKRTCKYYDACESDENCLHCTRYIRRADQNSITRSAKIQNHATLTHAQAVADFYDKQEQQEREDQNVSR
jgi:hypothetical protein